MYIYHALINALSAHMIHINLNIFYTDVGHSPTNNFFIQNKKIQFKKYNYTLYLLSRGMPGETDSGVPSVGQWWLTLVLTQVIVVDGVSVCLTDSLLIDIVELGLMQLVIYIV